MILDGKLIYKEDFDIGVSATTAGTNTSDVLNHGIGEDAFGTAQTPDISNDGEMWWTTICENEDFASSGSPVVTYELRTADNESMTSASTIASFTGDKTPNDGDVLKSMVVPAGEVKQYTDVKVSATANVSAGKISTWLSSSPMFDKRLS